MSLTRVALAMIVAAVFAVLLAPRQGPYVLQPMPATSTFTFPACHGEAVWYRGGKFHACVVPQ